MSVPVLLAGTVMDQAAAILNDTAKNLYSYTVQLPYIKKANEDLEQTLLVYGVNIQFKKSAAIAVAAGATTLVLPSDFLVPISLWERASGSTNEDDYVEMDERDWEENTQAQSTLTQWSFRENGINLVPSTANREVKLYYDKMLTVVNSENSTEDSILFKSFLAAKTAEYCARFIGMNKVMADEIRDNECFKAEDKLVHILVGNMQGIRFRRPKFTTKNLYRIR